MVGGRDHIDPQIQWVNGILAEYDETTYVNKVLNRADGRTSLIDRCFNGLYTWEKELLVALCVKKISERAYARKTGLSRYRVREEKKRLLRLTARVLRESVTCDPYQN